ncbi:hypothetical protein [Pantoea dispersa]|uniref:hypothetical protein n=1 Tax=Pantoea dispersa TaxID=59814 RepID=UPI0021C8F57E|nr:hypothetical protein [Pantoea dispersa]MDR6295029.1 hypothetical protein [Pantoea dispersa]UXO70853.1 hypothetical protein N7977_19745 [Pantoea dispersa]
MNSQDEPEEGKSSAPALNRLTESKFFSVILYLYQSTGLIYGFYDGQPYTKKTLSEESSDGSE